MSTTGARVLARVLRLAAWVAAGLAAASSGCGGDAPGLRVDLDLAGFGTNLSTLEIVLSAAPGGFAVRPAEDVGGVSLRTEDRNADQVTDLAMRFSTAAGFRFGSKVSFRIETGNRAQLTLAAAVLGFDGKPALIAGADGNTTLAGGGEATLTLRLEARTGMVIPGAGTVRLGEAGAADVVLPGPHKDAKVSSVALCNVDGDEFPDVVVGAPGASPSTAVGATGAVYVVFGSAAPSAMVTLGSPPGGTREFHVYGVAGGDQLGAAVACADVDGDSADDLIMGAPGAEGGAGAVYLIQGRAALPNTVFDLSKVPPASGAPDVTWVGGAAGARLGSVLYAADLDNMIDGAVEVVAAAPGPPAQPAAARVYVWGRVNAATGGWKGRQVVADTGPAQVTIAGIPAASLAAGDLDSSGVPLDLILGDPSYQKAAETSARGAVYVFPGVGPATPGMLAVADAKLLLEGGLRSQLGAAVVALDTRAAGQGTQDLVAGAPGDRDGTGTVQIFYGDTAIFNTLMRTPNNTLAGAALNDRYGSALSGATTLAGTRLYVGAPAVTDGGRAGAGAVYVYRGDAAGPTLVEQIFGAVADGRLGAALAGGAAGGTAISDLVVVAPDAPAAETGAGVAYVRLGH